MGDIKLDKNYNILEVKNAYNDEMVDSVGLVKEAQSKNVITEEQASLLLKFILNREFKKEARTILPFTQQTPQIFSLFMNLKDKQVKHAS